jgi:hypothetical protein
VKADDKHLKRMEDHKFPKYILDYKLIGREYVGRPRKRWKD